MHMTLYTENLSKILGITSPNFMNEKLKANPFFISVIIPVYNGEAYLAEAVESVRAQGYQSLEIIIVDDGSTDGTAQLCKRFGRNVRYIFQKNSGPPAARNTGLRLASGNVIAFLDADDLWCKNKLELQLTRLTDNPSVEVVVGQTQLLLLSDSANDKPKFEPFAKPWLALNLGSATFRQSVFDKVGLFDESLRHCDDWDWFMRIRELGVPITTHKEVTRFYRRHDRNLTHQKELGNHYTLQMLKKSIDRRKQQNDGLATSLRKMSDYEEPNSDEENKREM